MKFINLKETVLNFIKKQALLSEDETYGWLIGYKDNDEVNIFGAFDCQSYIQRSMVSAIPDPLELQKIGNFLPYGVEFVGIYHSHPEGGKVFHSHIDDKNLLSLSRQLPDCLSLVTNGYDINYYLMNEKFELIEIEPNFGTPVLPKFLLIYFNNTFTVKIDKNLLLAENLSNKIYNNFLDYLLENWDIFELHYKKSSINYNEKVKSYLQSSFKGDYLKIKLPKEIMQESVEVEIYDEDLDRSNIEFVPLEFKLNSFSVLYTSGEQIFNEIRDAIRDVLINENLMPKIFHCTLNLSTYKIMIPDEFYFNFFGIFIKKLFYPVNASEFDKDLSINNNVKKLSEKNYSFLERMDRVIDLYSIIDSDKESKKFILRLTNDLIEFSKNQM